LIAFSLLPALAAKEAMHGDGLRIHVHNFDLILHDITRMTAQPIILVADSRT
jgi:hypothetical protein